MLRNWVLRLAQLKNSRAIQSSLYKQVRHEYLSKNYCQNVVFRFFVSSTVGRYSSPINGVNNPIETAENRSNTIKYLETTFECSESDAIKAYDILEAENKTKIDVEITEPMIKWFLRNGATLPIVLKNSNLLLMSTDTVRENFCLLSKNNKWKAVDDFLPLIEIRHKKLKKLLGWPHTKNSILERIYYFSKEFQIEPNVVSKYLAKHTFLFEIQDDLLKNKLRLLLVSGIAPINLLRDLNVFARAEEAIVERLKYIKENDIQKIMPWMIKCEDHVLERTIQIRQHKGTGIEYLAKRLNWHGQTAISMYNKHHYIRCIGVLKVSAMLDVLMGTFNADQITKNVQIFSHSPEKIKKRINELASLDLPITLSILCRNEKWYQIYIKVKLR